MARAQENKDQRMVDPRAVDPRELEPSDPALRPRSLDEYVGQERIKANLKVYIQAARQRGEALDHILLSGPPGLGKTSLAQIIASELGVGIRCTSGPSMERGPVLAAILHGLGPREVLFIDEIHRTPRPVEEILYPAMEDFRIDVSIGQGPTATTVRVPLKRFTLIGATTRSGLLTSPLRARFGIHCVLDFYQPDELQRILLQSAQRLKLTLEPAGALELAQRSRGTPRIANRLLRRIRDFAEVESGGRIGMDLVRSALDRLGVDPQGLDSMDRRILDAIGNRFDGGPVGINNLAAAIGEEAETLEEVYEPFLIREGLLQRTPQGRVLTSSGRRMVGLPDQTGLFR